MMQKVSPYTTSLHKKSTQEVYTRSLQKKSTSPAIGLLPSHKTIVVDTQTMFATNVTQAVQRSRSSFTGSAASFSTSKTVVRAPVQQLTVEGTSETKGHLALGRHATVPAYARPGRFLRDSGRY